MNVNIAIDFGASRIKSISFSNSHKIIDRFETIGSNYFKNNTINPNFFYKSFIKHLNYYSKKYKFTKIIICSEMHGYALFNKQKNKISKYFSWRFQRNHKKSKKIIKDLEKKKFQKITGLKPRIGLPIINWLSDKSNKKERNYLCGIGEILCIIGGKYHETLHSTYAQSTGLYKLNNNSFFNKEIFSNKIVEAKKNLIGTIIFKNMKKYIYGGYGDLQTAFTGSNIKNNEFLINMGTGSQIILKNNTKYNINFEKRNYFNKILYCKTHIPSGRSLNLIAEKINKIYRKKDYFWREIKKIKLNNLIECNNIIDLDYFRLKKTLKNKEIKKNLNNFIIIVLKSYCDQYINYINNTSFKKMKFKRVILSGGIPKRIPIIKNYIYQKTGIKTKIYNSRVDETLIGLLKLSKYNL